MKIWKKQWIQYINMYAREATCFLLLPYTGYKFLKTFQYEIHEAKHRRISVNFIFLSVVPSYQMRLGEMVEKGNDKL
jgi:hypothetical protein